MQKWFAKCYTKSARKSSKEMSETLMKNVVNNQVKNMQQKFDKTTQIKKEGCTQKVCKIRSKETSKIFYARLQQGIRQKNI